MDNNNFYESEKLLEQQSMEQQGLSRKARRGDDFDETLLDTQGLGRYTAKTFLMMFLGLMVTFGTAMFLAYTIPGLQLVVKAIRMTGGYIHMFLLIAELIVAVGMTSMLHKISTATAAACFFLYSFLTGLTFSILFLVYDFRIMVFTFGLTALYFGGMAIFGFVTNMDLARIRPILIGGLVFLLVANLLMMFIPTLEVADQVLCSIGVVVFLAYTAYDTQKLRKLYFAYEGDEEMRKKVSIFSALQLYLDFVNMFLYLLRLLGKRSRK